MTELMLIENPKRRRRRRRRNPMAARNRSFALKSTAREWMQGVSATDVIAAAGGLAATTMVPGMVIKDTTTTMQKLMKLGVSIGVAIAAGAVGRTVIDASTGKAAIIGGIAGTATQAIAMFTNFQIGGRQGVRRLAQPRRVGETTVVSPSPSREAETINIISP